MCPGAKDYKSVTTDGVKRKKQKRLLLVNIKELYVEFRKKITIIREIITQKYTFSPACFVSACFN